MENKTAGAAEKELVRHYSDADWRGDEATRRLVSAGALMRGRTPFEGVDEEAAGGVPVHRQERAVRCSQSRVTRAGDAVRGEIPGDSVGVDPTPRCLSNHGPGQGEARRRTEPEDPRGIQVRKVRHEGSRHERESRRLCDEAIARTET